MYYLYNINFSCVKIKKIYNKFVHNFEEIHPEYKVVIYRETERIRSQSIEEYLSCFKQVHLNKKNTIVCEYAEDYYYYRGSQSEVRTQRLYYNTYEMIYLLSMFSTFSFFILDSLNNQKYNIGIFTDSLPTLWMTNMIINKKCTNNNIDVGAFNYPTEVYSMKKRISYRKSIMKLENVFMYNKNYSTMLENYIKDNKYIYVPPCINFIFEEIEHTDIRHDLEREVIEKLPEYLLSIVQNYPMLEIPQKYSLTSGEYSINEFAIHPNISFLMCYSYEHTAFIINIEMNIDVRLESDQEVFLYRYEICSQSIISKKKHNPNTCYNILLRLYGEDNTINTEMIYKNSGYFDFIDFDVLFNVYKNMILAEASGHEKHLRKPLNIR